ncbi:MAG: hypothetical protein Q8P02_02925 [Candidatus Micrarchaeota archaeon]|nr:hypothetical protein [Candidatus Micrarchaeota archaeon]
MDFKELFKTARNAIAKHAKGLNWNDIHESAGIPEDSKHRAVLEGVAKSALKKALSGYHDHLTEAAETHEKGREATVMEKAGALKERFLEKFGKARDDLHSKVEDLRQTALQIQLERAEEIERAKNQADLQVQSHANEKYKDYLRQRYGLGSLLNPHEFHQELAGLVGKQAAEAHWNPQAERGTWADQITRTINSLKGHRRLSHAFKIEGDAQETENAQRKLDRFVLRHTLGSLHGYEATDELLAKENLDHGHLLDQLNAMKPNDLKNMTPDRISALADDAIRAQKAAEATPEPKGKALFDSEQSRRPVTETIQPSRRPNLFQKIGLGLAGLSLVGGLGYGAYKLGNKIPVGESPRPTPSPTATQRPITPSPTQSGGPGREATDYRFSGSDFLKFVQDLKIVPNEYHPNFSVVRHDTLLAALLEGRAVEKGWATDTGNGTRFVNNRATRRAMEKEAKRLKINLDQTLRKMGPTAFKPVQGTGKPGTQYNTVDSTLRLVREMKIGGPNAHRVTARALGIRSIHR